MRVTRQGRVPPSWSISSHVVIWRGGSVCKHHCGHVCFHIDPNWTSCLGQTMRQPDEASLPCFVWPGAENNTEVILYLQMDGLRDVVGLSPRHECRLLRSEPRVRATHCPPLDSATITRSPFTELPPPLLPRLPFLEENIR